jgi:hypothetical protein
MRGTSHRSHGFYELMDEPEPLEENLAQMSEEDPDIAQNEWYFRRTRRLLFTIGAAILLSCALIFLALALLVGPPYNNIWQLLVSHLAGRLVNAGVGLERGFSPWFILFQSFMQDAVVLFFVYPFIIRGYQHLTHVRFVGPALLKAHAAAARQQARSADFGRWGLTLFIFPIMGTRPVIGLFLGFLLGYGTLQIFAIVLTGLFLSTVATIWGYQWVHDYNANLAIYGLVTLVALTVLVGVVLKLRAMYNRRIPIANIRAAEAAAAMVPDETGGDQQP